jgi:hypothetical protein
VLNRIKYPDEKKCTNHIILLATSTVVTQKFLEHSSPYLTNKVYTNVDPVLRHMEQKQAREDIEEESLEEVIQTLKNLIVQTEDKLKQNIVGRTKRKK